MKNLLTEKNLMWAAIVALSVIHLFPSLLRGKPEGRQDAMRQRMGQMREHMGSRGDTGRGEWTGPKAGADREKGRKKKAKDSE